MISTTPRLHRQTFKPHTPRPATSWALLLAAGLSTGSLQSQAAETEFSGYVDLEYRYFSGEPNDSEQFKEYYDAGGEFEWYTEFNDGDDSLTITPFVRYAERDTDRGHVDLREANWLHIGDAWDLRVGLGHVFWGVTESNHLIDIINQTDNLEGVDGEDKLGQPMVNFNYSTEDWGELSLFALPYFREREFVNDAGRPRTYPRTDADYAQFESEDEEEHVDYAARWIITLGDADVALSYFEGTSRDPSLIADTDNSGAAILAPYYEQIQQTSLDISWVMGSWLWKLEALNRQGLSNAQGVKEDYNAYVGGFEYTWAGFTGGNSNLGFLLEYNYDEREERATTIYQDDTFFGLRYTANTASSTSILLGVVADNQDDDIYSYIEASTRVGNSVKLSMEGHFYDSIDDSLGALENDDFVLFSFTYYM